MQTCAKLPVYTFDHRLPVPGSSGRMGNAAEVMDEKGPTLRDMKFKEQFKMIFQVRFQGPRPRFLLAANTLPIGQRIALHFYSLGQESRQTIAQVIIIKQTLVLLSNFKESPVMFPLVLSSQIARCDVGLHQIIYITIIT